ncbi:hypothetical protein K431DRAFT_329827 [Polychaeton citri CBS 116435]|uniref:Uncharacterized protein n=1 Tax=Polychaeton citri CBS 116435 TaxID=1314669 RepID=A0A9P4Q6F8_9PEZI|nr:hypothetical protein K431DRAFT_329827 [Polychaeton citri CBS 116435]
MDDDDLDKIWDVSCIVQSIENHLAEVDLIRYFPGESLWDPEIAPLVREALPDMLTFKSGPLKKYLELALEDWSNLLVRQYPTLRGQTKDMHTPYKQDHEALKAEIEAVMATLKAKRGEDMLATIRAQRDTHQAEVEKDQLGDGLAKLDASLEANNMISHQVESQVETAIAERLSKFKLDEQHASAVSAALGQQLDQKSSKSYSDSKSVLTAQCTLLTATMRSASKITSKRKTDAPEPLCVKVKQDSYFPPESAIHRIEKLESHRMTDEIVERFENFETTNAKTLRVLSDSVWKVFESVQTLQMRLSATCSELAKMRENCWYG